MKDLTRPLLVLFISVALIAIIPKQDAKAGPTQIYSDIIVIHYMDTMTTDIILLNPVVIEDDHWNLYHAPGASPSQVWEHERDFPDHSVALIPGIVYEIWVFPIE